jgi:hypothetical protein
MNEIWKSIKDYENLYQVSNLGRIRSMHSKWNNSGDKILCGRLHEGYYKIVLTKDGKASQKFIHRLIAEAFIPNPHNKPCINHINGIKTDNSIENLEWVTIQENCQHAHNTGLQPSRKGGNNPWSKLNSGQVLEIFHSTRSNREIAEQYNITRDAVSLIKTGKNWSHVTGKKYVRKKPLHTFLNLEK